MVTQEKSYLRNILLADDGSADARAAVDLLASLPHVSESRITVIRVFSALQTAEHQAIEDGLMRTKRLLMSRHLRVKAELLMGYPADKIIEYAEDIQPDLIVMGAKGQRATLGIPLGGVAMHIVEDGRWPVMVVRKDHARLENILLVVDGSECSDIACNYLGNFPVPLGAQVRVMHVMSEIYPDVLIEPFAGGVGVMPAAVTADDLKRHHEQQQKHAEKMLQGVVHNLAIHGLNAEPVLRRGDAATEIINFATNQNVDLIVAGSRGLGAIRSWFMGSVSRKLVHYSDCSVLIARCHLQKKQIDHPETP